MARLHCQHCGYDLSGVPDYGSVRVCPECSETTPIAAPDDTPPSLRAWLVPVAIATGLAMVLFVLSWIGAASRADGCLLIAGAIGIVGVIANGALAAWLAASTFNARTRQRALEWTGTTALSLAFFTAAIATALFAFAAAALGAAAGGHPFV